MKIQKSDRVEALNASCRFILILEYIPLTLPFPLSLSLSHSAHVLLCVGRTKSHFTHFHTLLLLFQCEKANTKKKLNSFPRLSIFFLSLFVDLKKYKKSSFFLSFLLVSHVRFLQAMEMVFKKGTAAIRAFFKRPHKHGHILCYIGLYTILQLQLVSARHHDIGKLLTVSGSSSSSENNNFIDKDLQLNAQINHSHENVEQSPIKQQPILGQKITQQTPGSDLGPSGAVLSKDDGK